MTNTKIVSVSGGEGPYNNIIKALSRLDLSPFAGKKILIKPNCGREMKSCGSVNTHPQAVAAVIDAVKNAGAASIAIGESPILGVNTLNAFELSGIAAVANEREVPLIDMDKRKPVTKPVSNGRILDSLKFCADIFDFDYIVSVPVAKAHMHTQVTLGIKNMKGCLWRHEKVRLHQLQYKEGTSFPEKTLDTAISDLAYLLLPNLTVVDGYLGMEGLGPSSGDAKQSDFAVASFHPLAADMVAAELMGFALDEIHHLRIIKERGIDSVSDTHIIPENYLGFKMEYKRSPSKIDIAFPDVIVHQGNACSACLSTTLLFLKRFAAELGDYVLPDGKLHVALGKDIPDGAPAGTIYIGNCTKRDSGSGLFISGCPPVASRIFTSITGSEPESNEP
ncbi:MAG: DUF362 domain-containing protein [Fibrobacteres bacterium]|nr:DUF362 domain-containing protein [Fibrobacterota bacterium]